MLLAPNCAKRLRAFVALASDDRFHAAWTFHRWRHPLSFSRPALPCKAGGEPSPDFHCLVFCQAIDVFGFDSLRIFTALQSRRPGLCPAYSVSCPLLLYPEAAFGEGGRIFTADRFGDLVSVLPWVIHPATVVSISQVIHPVNTLLQIFSGNFTTCFPHIALLWLIEGIFHEYTTKSGSQPVVSRGTAHFLYPVMVQGQTIIK